MVGIINLTQTCNLACKYCFEEQWKDKQLNIKCINQKVIASKKTLLEFVRQLSIELDKENEEPLEILFHGGEPLLIKPSVLKELMEDMKRINDNIVFLVQTNGTTINEEWVKVLQEFNVKVGVSLDGDKELNDSFRVSKSGNGTFDTIMKNISLLKKYDIEVGCLATITSQSLKNIQKLYDFFSKYNINFSFNPFFVPSNDDYSFANFELSNFTKSVYELFDLWINDNESHISIPYFEYIIDGLINEKHVMRTCDSIQNCFDEFTAIDLDGSIYICNHFCEKKELALGNLNEQSIRKIREKGNELLNKRWKLLKEGECKECIVQPYCHGGCPYHSLVQSGTYFAKDQFCEANKNIILYIYRRMKEELEL